MKFLPIFLNVDAAPVLVAGGGAAAVAKLRLLRKTTARLVVFAREADDVVEAWARAGDLTLERRPLAARDLVDARLVYAASEDPDEDARVVRLAEKARVPFNVVDNLDASRFLTPAMVDRDPLVVAIGTEGAAPVLARSVKRLLEERLPSDLGATVRLARSFRPRAEALPQGEPRRAFWSRVFDRPAWGRRTRDDLERLLGDAVAGRSAPGRVLFVGAGPGDPDDLTMRARRALDAADVVIHDRLVPGPILELARREAQIIEAGKTGFGASVPQAEIDRLIVDHAARGQLVVRLKSGDPSVFGRLDDEIDACERAGIDWSVLPGLTAASAAAAALGQSLTRRGRNSELRIITGHDVQGMAEHDWVALAREGTVAAIYMGKRAARFIQGRLLMHGAKPETPVSIVENAGRPEQRIVAARLDRLASDLAQAGLSGPAVILLGLAPRNAQAAIAEDLREAAI